MSAAELAGLGGLVAAPIVGSFLGTVIERLPARRDMILARSACPHCGQRLGALDLVPLASWLVLRGRCRHCGAWLGYFYPLVELAALAVAASAALALDDAPALVIVASLLLGWTLLALAWIDARHLLLPDALTLPLTPAGLVASWAIRPETILDHGIGAVAGGLAFWLTAFVYRRVRGREGLGGGDIKLMAAAGAWVAWDGLASVILVAALAAIVFALIAAARTPAQAPHRMIPFGPFLALGIWIVWLVGPLSLP